MKWADLCFLRRAKTVRLPKARARLVRRVGAWSYENEQPLRTLLRLSLDPVTGVRRPAHRLEWIAEALAPVRNRMDDATYSKVANALTLLLGIDPIVVMTDIAGATRKKRWSPWSGVRGRSQRRRFAKAGGKRAGVDDLRT